MTLVLIFGGYAFALFWGLYLMYRGKTSCSEWAGFYRMLVLSVSAPLIGWLIFLATKTISSGNMVIPVVCTLGTIIFILTAFALRPPAASIAQVSIHIAGSIIVSALSLAELFLWANYGFMGANA